MDKVEKYSGILNSLFLNKATQRLAGMEEVRPHPIIDRERKEYVLMWIGWAGDEYVHGIMFHVQIVADKIVIYKDNTDIDLKTFLQEQGVEQNDIIVEAFRKEMELYT